MKHSSIVQRTLASLKVGAETMIRHLALQRELVKKLMITGIMEGKRVKILYKKSNGSIILQLENNSIVIGKNVAQGILI